MGVRKQENGRTRRKTKSFRCSRDFRVGNARKQGMISYKGIKLQELDGNEWQIPASICSYWVFWSYWTTGRYENLHSPHAMSNMK